MKPGRSLGWGWNPPMNRRDALAAFVVAGVGGCARMPDPWLDQPGRPRILVTFPPLYSMARLIAGDSAAVKCLCVSTGPHHYNFNPRDLALLANADIFFSVGLTLDDHFVSRMLQSSRRGKARFDALGDTVKARKLCLAGDSGHEDHHDEGHDHNHSHGEEDPHIWLGVPQAVVMAERMADQLAAVSPGEAEQFRARAGELGSRLKEFQRDARQKMRAKTERRLISFHGALAYLADSFSLQIAATMQINPGSEPSAGRIAQLVRMCKEEQVSVLAVEPQYSTGTSARLLAEALKREGIEARMIEIDPMETAEASELDASWYERTMRKNLQALLDRLP